MTDEEKKRWEKLFRSSGVRILCHPDDVQGLPDNEIVRILVRRFGKVDVFASAALVPGRLLFQPDAPCRPEAPTMNTEQPEPPWNGLHWYQWFCQKDHPMRIET